MCLEDLKLGRGRFAGKPVNAVVQTAATDFLPPDARRVAIMFNFLGGIDNASLGPNGQPDFAQLFAPDVSVAVPIVVMNMYMPTFVMRIEDWGQIVQGALQSSIVALSGSQTQLIAVPILTNVVADAKFN